MTMKDDPIALVQDNRARRCEQAAMRAYRAKYPSGPAWLDLHAYTRGIWIGFIEQAGAF